MLYFFVEKKRRKGKWWLYRYLGLYLKYTLNGVIRRGGGEGRKVGYKNI